MGLQGTNRRWFMLANRVVAALAAAVVATTAAAQPARGKPRIAFLGFDSAVQATRQVAFEDGLRQLGYVNGSNVVIEYRWAEGRFDRMPELAAQLVAAKPDVIVTAAPPAVRAVQAATRTIPIVMIVHDPIGLGFAESLAHPGGNITGVGFQDSEFSIKRLDILRAIVPNLTRIAILWNRQGGGDDAVRAVEKTANAMKIATKVLEVREEPDIAKTVAEAKVWGAQGVMQLASPFFGTHRKRVVDLLVANRLPATCEQRQFVEDGCLMTYGANLDPMFRQLASYVDRILRGANPADLPIEQPREFEFVINERTALALGLVIPLVVLMQTTDRIK